MHQVRIIDPSALRDVLERVKALRGGTDRRTAEFLGIEQPTFTRLRNGTTTQFVHPGTYYAIRRALRSDAVEFGLLGRLEGAFLEGEAWLVLQQFQSWAEREYTRLRDCGASVVLDELYAIPAYRSHFDRLLQRTGRELWSEVVERRLVEGMKKAAYPPA